MRGFVVTVDLPEVRLWFGVLVEGFGGMNCVSVQCRLLCL